MLCYTNSIVNLRVNADSIDQARRASAQVRTESAAAAKDLGALEQQLPPKQSHPWLNGPWPAEQLLHCVLFPRNFQRQKTLAALWGVNWWDLKLLQAYRPSKLRITSTLSSRLMERKLSDKAGAEGGIPPIPPAP